MVQFDSRGTRFSLDFIKPYTWIRIDFQDTFVSKKSGLISKDTTTYSTDVSPELVTWSSLI